MKHHRIPFLIFAVVFCLYAIGCGSDSDNPVTVKKSDPSDRVPELNMYAVADPTTDVTAVIESDVDEKLVVLGEKNFLGIPTKITGFSFIDAADKAFTMQMNAEGLPEYIAVGGLIYRLHNYTDNSVSVIVSNEAGEWVQAHDVQLDPTVVQYLRDFVFSGFPTASSGDSQMDALTPEEILSIWGSVKKYANKAADVAEDAVNAAADAAVDGADWLSGEIGSAADLAAREAKSVAKRLLKFTESTALTVGSWVADFGGTVVGLYIMPIYNAVKNFIISFKPNTSFDMQVRLSWVGLQNLDIHLWTPMIMGSTYHVSPSFAGAIWGAMGLPPYAQIDGLSIFPPGENLSIKTFYSGTYYVSVQHKTGLGLITTSQATIEVRHSDGTKQTFDVPTTSSNPNAWWNVLSINGNNGTVTPINTITDNAPR